MSPRTTSFSLDQVLEAALKLLRESGAAGLSARALAKTLGTSTMPIYSAAGGMVELAAALRERIAAELAAYQARNWSVNPAMDAAVGYVMFARDEPALFKFLWSPAPGEAGKKSKLPLDSIMARSREYEATPENVTALLSALPEAERRPFTLHNWIFIHGIAALVAEGLFELDDGSLVGHLEAAGGAFYQFHLSRNGGAR